MAILLWIPAKLCETPCPSFIDYVQCVHESLPRIAKAVCFQKLKSTCTFTINKLEGLYTQACKSHLKKSEQWGCRKKVGLGHQQISPLTAFPWEKLHYLLLKKNISSFTNISVFRKQPPHTTQQNIHSNAHPLLLAPKIVPLARIHTNTTEYWTRQYSTTVLCHFQPLSLVWTIKRCPTNYTTGFLNLLGIFLH